MFEGPSPKYCWVISLFCTRAHCDLDLCQQGHLMVKTNIPSKFKGSSLKHRLIISFLVLKVMVTLTMTFALGIIYLWGPTSPLSMRVLAPSIAKLSSFLVLKVLVTLTFALRIIYWWGPTSLLSLSRIVSSFGTKGHNDLDLWLKGHLLFRSILLSVHLGRASVHPRGVIWTLLL